MTPPADSAMAYRPIARVRSSPEKFSWMPVTSRPAGPLDPGRHLRLGGIRPGDLECGRSTSDRADREWWAPRGHRARRHGGSSRGTQRPTGRPSSPAAAVRSTPLRSSGRLRCRDAHLSSMPPCRDHPSGTGRLHDRVRRMASRRRSPRLRRRARSRRAGRRNRPRRCVASRLDIGELTDPVPGATRRR